MGVTNLQHEFSDMTGHGTHSITTGHKKAILKVLSKSGGNQITTGLWHKVGMQTSAKIDRANGGDRPTRILRLLWAEIRMQKWQD